MGQLADALAASHSREGWDFSCFLVGTGIRAKKRWQGRCPPPSPSIDEWQRQMALPGCQGGQRASCLWRGPCLGLPVVLKLDQQLLEPPSQFHARALGELTLPCPPATLDFALACDLGTQDADMMFD